MEGDDRAVTADPIPRDFYRRDARLVAPELLNKLLVRSDGRAGRIVEVEAYCGGEDPASHSFKGPTQRNAVMFGPPGHLYVYFTYGMHWCCNPVCGEDGEGVAVLLRALAPVAGLGEMRKARGPAVKRDRDLCNGPAKLCEALGITRAENAADLTTGAHGVWIADDGTAPPIEPANGVRIGISAGIDHLWRWWVPGDPNVSRRG
jgi:DNA-3-methyladenine glycosylase